MKLTWRRQTLRTRHRFATASGEGGITEKQTIVVELAHDGVTGFGEAVPSALYGQSLESCEAALGTIARLLEEFSARSAAPATLSRNAGNFFETEPALTPFAIEQILRAILDRLDRQRAAVDALDAALHDWVGKRLGAPVWKLLGLPQSHARTTFTIGVADLAETRLKVREALAAGFRALKVKIGTADELERLEIVRDLFAGPLLLDANEGWTVADAPRRIEALKRFDPLLIEQPLPEAQWRELATLRNNGVAPIFVDESCKRPADVVKLHGLVDGINIKLNKCGGMREALRMIALARGLNMQVMLGCFVSSSLAIAPALAIASLADWADLDGALLLAEDPFEGLTYRDGWLTGSERPGLGVEPRRT
jgi:L-Ala-D/L-Glu epimerase